MLTVVETRNTQVSSAPAESTEAQRRVARGSGSEVYTLSAGDTLFREGDPRSHVFRVETGAICLYHIRPDGTQDVIEFAFPGDLIGLGYLDDHVSNAQATVETSICCLPRAGFDPATRQSPHMKARLTAAIDREVTFLEEPLVDRSNRPTPVERVAALFVTLSRCNAYEGRDPSLITDSLKCGVVADYLNMSVDFLATQLSELEARGLIGPSEKGLRLNDIAALEKLVDDTA